MFIKKMQERIGDKETLEKKLLLILKRVNTSAKETAEYIYDNLELWYDIGKNYENGKNYDLCLMLDDIALDPQTFEFNDKEDLNLVLKRKKIKDPTNFFSSWTDRSYEEKRNYALKQQNQPLERIIISIGDNFLLYHLSKLLEKDVEEIEKNPAEYDPNISSDIVNLYKSISFIFHVIDGKYSLYDTKCEDIYIKIGYSTSGYSTFKDTYPGAKRLPGFDTLPDDNKYIKMLRDKEYDELIEILDSMD